MAAELDNPPPCQAAQHSPPTCVAVTVVVLPHNSLPLLRRHMWLHCSRQNKLLAA